MCLYWSLYLIVFHGQNAAHPGLLLELQLVLQFLLPKLPAVLLLPQVQLPVDVLQLLNLLLFKVFHLFLNAHPVLQRPLEALL